MILILISIPTMIVNQNDIEEGGPSIQVLIPIQNQISIEERKRWIQVLIQILIMVGGIRGEVIGGESTERGGPFCQVDLKVPIQVQMRRGGGGENINIDQICDETVVVFISFLTSLMMRNRLDNLLISMRFS